MNFTDNLGDSYRATGEVNEGKGGATSLSNPSVASSEYGKSTPDSSSSTQPISPNTSSRPPQSADTTSGTAQSTTTTENATQEGGTVEKGGVGGGGGGMSAPKPPSHSTATKGGKWYQNKYVKIGGGLLAIFIAYKVGKKILKR